jgi:phosphopantetheine adenylyltransferase
MHLLVVANETVTGRKLIEAVERRKGSSDLQVTVIAPVSQPQRGYVVYEDTRRAAAGRRLDRTLSMLREEGISAHGLVVETDPVTAVRDALAQLEPPVDEIILATHPQQKSGWLRKNVVDRIRESAGSVPVEHVVVDMAAETGARTSSFLRMKRSWATRCWTGFASGPRAAARAS